MLLGKIAGEIPFKRDYKKLLYKIAIIYFLLFFRFVFVLSTALKNNDIPIFFSVFSIVLVVILCALASHSDKYKVNKLKNAQRMLKSQNLEHYKYYSESDYMTDYLRSKRSAKNEYHKIHSSIFNS